MTLVSQLQEIIIAILLGIIQGFTEFLPISSSGHLTFAIELFNVDYPLAFEILLHLATLFAVLIYTFPLIKLIIISFIHITFKRSQYKDHKAYEQDLNYFKLFVALGISTLITAPIGFAIKDIVTSASMQLVGSLWIVTAFILALPFLIPSTRRTIQSSLASQNSIQSNSPNNNDSHSQEYEIFTNSSWSYIILFSIILGAIQGGAIFPGISRSGATITAAVLLGLNYTKSTRYSFLMAIPAILASFIFSIPDLPALMSSISYTALTVSMLVTFFTALVGLRWLSFIAKKGKMWVFSLYLLVIGVIALVM